MHLDRPYPSFGHACLLCVLFVGLQGVLMIPVAVAGAILKTPLHMHPLTVGVVNLAACALVLWIGSMIGRASLREALRPRCVPGRLYLPVLLAGAGAVLVLSEIDNLVRSLLPVPDWIARIFQESLSSLEHPLSGAVLLVVVAPLTEEILFRGFILRGLLRWYRAPVAILLSAALFAAVHLNPWQLASAAAMGILAGWWYARTGSVLPGIAGHAALNGAAAVVPWLPLDVPGLTQENVFAPPEFQPLGLDVLGLGLLALGVWIFKRWCPPAVRTEASTSTPEPPLEAASAAIPRIQPPPLPPANPPAAQ